jgi:hypothetical protein
VLEDEGVYLDCPAPDYWAITDINSVDNLLEFAIQDYAPATITAAAFFRYDGGGLYTIGAWRACSGTAAAGRAASPSTMTASSGAT